VGDAGTSLVLQLIEGPPTGGVATRWRADPVSALTIGRGQDARVQLPDASVSRRHAEVAFDGVEWVVRDCGSRHGTGVNSRLVGSGGNATLTHRDVLQIGPWAFRVLIAGEPTGAGMTMSVTDGPGRVRRVLPTEIGSLAQRRLDLVLDAAERLGRAESSGQIADAVVATVLEGAGSARVALVRREGGELVPLASGGAEAGGSFELSRSLVEEAFRGEIVLLESDRAPDYAQSIVQLGIQSAFCAPVRVGERVEAVLYLDARAGETTQLEDSVAFVNAMARICGLAMANLSRAHLERQRAQLESDLTAARVAQRIMMPPSSGEVGAVRFAVLSEPGRFVAGDLVGLEPRSDGRVCFFLGDVTGKGAGAAMLMGIAQSYLAASLAGGAAIEEAVNGLHALIAPRIEPGLFISLWIGEFDPAARTLRSVDAGHGYAVLRGPDGSLQTGFGEGGIPLAIDPDARYRSGTAPCPAGTTLLLFSDGLVEQANAEGDMFGMKRVSERLLADREPADLLRTLASDLTAFRAGDRFDDDLTLAAFRFG
jgi:serine phosphatase RsbU (regulator of sigma subunit)